MITAKSFTNKVTKSKVSVNVNLEKDLEGLSKSEQTKLKKLVGDTIIDEIEKTTMKKESTTKAERYEKLSKAYRKKKLASGKGGQPNLRLTDSMIDDLFSKNNTNGVEIKITDSLSKKKAENHNHGVTVPKRQFLPTQSGKGFRRDIMKAVNAKIRDFKKEIK